MRLPFPHAGFDHPQATFQNNGAIVDALKDFLEGTVRSGARALGSLVAGLRIPTYAWWCRLRLCQFSISFSKPWRQGNRLDRWKLAGSVQSRRLVPGQRVN